MGGTLTFFLSVILKTVMDLKISDNAVGVIAIGKSQKRKIKQEEHQIEQKKKSRNRRSEQYFSDKKYT